MPKMKIAVVNRAGADFELQEREIPQPGPGHRLQVGSNPHQADRVELEFSLISLRLNFVCLLFALQTLSRLAL